MKRVLSSADVARLFQVTETTIKRWADGGTLQCEKTPGGHRRFQFSSVLEFAEATGFHPPLLPRTLTTDAVPACTRAAIAAGDFEGLAEDLLSRALSNRPGAVTDFVLGLSHSNIALAQLSDQVFPHAMERIGDLWISGEIGADLEHRVSYELIAAIGRIEAVQEPRNPANDAILLACPAGEMHELGLRAIAGTVRLEGWQVIYLGANMPARDIINSVRIHRPTVTCLSITQPNTSKDRQEELRTVYAAVREANGRFVLGGSGVTTRYADARLCDVVENSAAGLLSYIRATARRHACPTTPD